ncbi:nitrilase-related carbon-nitrogen hydrolase [Maricaulis sp.]|uniref:carbon-nitrogen hydrolase family protein n=1 Tax=Maricaulis sp. TaxID=1486257 RepID=UPI003A906E33
MSVLSIAAIQVDAATEGNLDLVEQEIRSVAKRFPWVVMVALGELVIHGASLARAEPAGGETEQRLQALARETGLWIIPGSLYERRDDVVFNTTPVINPDGEIVGRFDKLFPFLPYEQGVASGVDYPVFDIPGIGTIGVAICFDMWFPEAIRTLCAKGAEVIILPTMTNTVDRDVELSIARANAAINQCYFVDINVAGAQGNGRSIVYGPGGELLHEAGAGREVMAFELDLEHVRRCRDRGWNGLGQILKSYRDAPVRYPLHADPAARQASMKHLGPLAMPQRQGGATGAANEGEGRTSKPRLSIIE